MAKKQRKSSAMALARSKAPTATTWIDSLPQETQDNLHFDRQEYWSEGERDRPSAASLFEACTELYGDLGIRISTFRTWLKDGKPQ